MRGKKLREILPATLDRNYNTWASIILSDDGSIAQKIYGHDLESAEYNAGLVYASGDLLAAAKEYIRQYNGNSTPAELYQLFVSAVAKAEANQLQGIVKNQWWGYKHTSGTHHAKRYNDQRDIQEAHESPFVKSVAGPFEAATRDEALAYIKEHTA